MGGRGFQEVALEDEDMTKCRHLHPVVIRLTQGDVVYYHILAQTSASLNCKIYYYRHCIVGSSLFSFRIVWPQFLYLLFPFSSGGQCCSYSGNKLRN
jgi:hypothetical protein